MVSDGGKLAMPMTKSLHQTLTASETDRKIGVISYDRKQYYINSRSKSIDGNIENCR